MPVKLYGKTPEGPQGRYCLTDCVGTRKDRIEGIPDPRRISISTSSDRT